MGTPGLATGLPPPRGLLAGVVYLSTGTLRLEAIYLAGTLFGLYEAYLTKVLWTPTWEPIPVRLGGVHVFETVLLVLLWHPWLAFVVPLLLVETLGTRSRLVLDGLPGGLRSRLTGHPGRVSVAGLLVLGLFQGSIYPDPSTALASALATSAVLAAALYTWRRRVGPDRYAVGELLPAGRELVALGVLLAAMYVAYGAGLRPAYLPGLGSQAAVWVLNLVFGALLVLRLRRDRRERRGSQPTGRVVPLREVIRYAAIYVLAVGVGTLLLRTIAPVTYVVLYLVALAVGGAMLAWIVRGLRGSSAA